MKTSLILEGDTGGTDDTIELRQVRESSTGNNFSETITVRKDATQMVTGTKSFSECHYSGRASYYKVLVNGFDSGAILTPNEFADYIKIVFEVESVGGIVRLRKITGIPSGLFDGIRDLLGLNVYKGQELVQIYPAKN